MTASLTDTPRLVIDGESASTRRILQLGQAALTMSRSSAISWPQPQPASAAGGVVLPRWFTLRKQPLAVVQAGSPNCER